MATTDHWRPDRRPEADPGEQRGAVRWLAPDAKPATMIVLDVLKSGDLLTAAELADATGFTRRSIDRILGELATAGAVRETVRGSRPSMYWRQRRTNTE